MNRLLIPSILFLIVQVLILPAFGWDKLGHYAINKEAGVNSVGDLPDIWPNYRMLRNITEWFCWSHGVQRTGIAWKVPNEPSYPNDGREPGEDMYVLVKYKLKEPTELAKKTALAFVGHNVADRVVHYSYFLAGPPKDNWTIHHADKELWAEYIIYTRVLKGRFESKTHKPTLRINIRCQCDPKIIQLAQRVFMKNRRGISKGKNGIDTGLQEPDSLDAIVKRAQHYETQSQKEVDKMSYRQLQKLEKVAEEYQWSELELLRIYLRSVDAVKAVYASHP